MCYTGICPYERPAGPTDTMCIRTPGNPCYMEMVEDNDDTTFEEEKEEA